MMAALIFLLKSVLCSALLLSYYALFLRKKALNRFNRFYLLFTIAASGILPLLHFEWRSDAVPDAGPSFYRMLNVVNGNGGEEDITRGSAPVVSPLAVIASVYGLVSLSLLLSLVIKILRIYQLKKKLAPERKENYYFLNSSLENAPFSFLNLLFWRADIDINSSSGKRILQHELTHIREKHTLDKLFVQMILCMLWANPFLWLLHKELSLVHEFIADEAAVDDSDPEGFALMLLQAHYGGKLTDIVHPFFQSPIKRRLLMLQNIQTSGFTALRRLMAVPVLAASILLISFERKDTAVIKAKEEVVLALDAGHGGHDKGAVGANGILEKELTLKVVDKLAELAGDYNIRIVKVRKADEYPTLLERPALAEKGGATIYMSIHINKDANDDASKELPYEMIVDERNPHYTESQRLASAIAPGLDQAKTPSRLLQKHLAVLGNAPMPAVLLELGNIFNEKQLQVIQNDGQLEPLCRNILSGIVDYKNSK